MEKAETVSMKTPVDGRRPLALRHTPWELTEVGPRGRRN